jgi:hypothetical protein
MTVTHESVGAFLLERFARKNPLAASLRLIFERLFESAAIDAVFEGHRELQYQRKILFSVIVEVMLAVVTRKVGSVHAALQQRKGAIHASFTAFYNKLNCSEAATSEALVRHAFERGEALLVAMAGLCEDRMPGWRVRVLDGNHLPATERRLQALWGVAAGPLPGLALAVYDMATRMVSDVVLCEDGHAQERSLTTRILALVQPGDCWVADRNFCTLEILFGILANDAAFVIRQHANLPGELVGPRIACGRCATGALFEQPIKISFLNETRILRRITVVLDAPIRDGDLELHILSSLPDEISAAMIALLYAKRWTIETAFADLATWLNSEIAPLGYPRAALLGFSVAVMAYNAVAALLGAMRATHGEETVQEKVSGYYIAEYGRDAVGGIDDVTEPEDWLPWQTMPQGQAAALLKAIAATIPLSLVQKHKRGPKKPVPKRTRYEHDPHVSTAKILSGTAKPPRKKPPSKTR